MASIRIRFKDGETSEWPLKDGMDLQWLERLLRQASLRNDGVLSLRVASEGGRAADYDTLGVKMADVSSWEITGMFDDAQGAALWAELEGLDDA